MSALTIAYTKFIGAITFIAAFSVFMIFVIYSVQLPTIVLSIEAGSLLSASFYFYCAAYRSLNRELKLLYLNTHVVSNIEYP
jgi:hypothetical protein